MDDQSTGFEGLAAFQSQVIRLLDAAGLAGVRRMEWVAADFERWPLGHAALLDALTTWARQPGRQLCLLARQYDELRLNHPSFVQWRRSFAHVVDARTPEDEGVELPCQLLLDRQRAIVVHDRAGWRGVMTAHAPSVHAIGRALEPVWARAVPAFPPSVLGL